jgi:hypothetical protein
MSFDPFAAGLLFKERTVTGSKEDEPPADGRILFKKPSKKREADSEVANGPASDKSKKKKKAEKKSVLSFAEDEDGD